MGGFIVGGAVGAIGMNSYINYKAYHGDLPWLDKRDWEGHCRSFMSTDQTIKRVREIMKQRGITPKDLERDLIQNKNQQNYQRKNIGRDQYPREDRQR